MDAAKQAVHKFTNKFGHHTDVDEVVNPAVTRETVKPTQHEEITKAVDREVHQDHYHTTVQPIAHSETLPERHTHNALPVENREFVHGDHSAVKQNVAAELGQFANSSVTQSTKHTQSAAPTVSGEHVHHHVHETVQPVIHKETIQPEVIHTTVPIHETHHAEAQHHGVSALPMKSLGEFQAAGGVLSGTKTHAHEEYDGAPRPYNKDLQTTTDKVLSGVGLGHHTGSHTTGTTGSTGLAGTHNTSGTTGSGLTGTHNTSDTTGSGLTGTHHTSGTTGSGLTGTHNTSSTHRHNDSGVGGVGHDGTKPSLADKLNPKTDADRDGKAGIMD